jgi:glycerophosphoryl diester phosphodiesterase
MFFLKGKQPVLPLYTYAGNKMKNKPLVLGHRGYRRKYPENTLLAFRKAFEYGADGIECDVQKSSDGLYFIFHDLDLCRITGAKGDINAFTSVKLKKLKAGRGQAIPGLEAFLGSLPEGKFINIELKEDTLTTDDSPVILARLAVTGVKTNLLISSFKHELLPFFKKNGYLTGMLFETESLEKDLFGQIMKIIKFRPWSVNLPVNIFTHMNFPLKLFILLMKIFKIKLIFWTVNTNDQFTAVKDLSYAVITDDVEYLLTLRDKGVDVAGTGSR